MWCKKHVKYVKCEIYQEICEKINSIWEVIHKSCLQDYIPYIKISVSEHTADTRANIYDTRTLLDSG